MTLNNLVGISLEKISIDLNTIKRLITAAKRNIADAKITAVRLLRRYCAGKRGERLHFRG